MNIPEETFRGRMRGRTPEGESTTRIVTRRSLGRAGRTWWPTFNGAIRTMVVLTDQEAMQLAGLLGDVSSARESP
jgi:hypothetical protein